MSNHQSTPGPLTAVMAHDGRHHYVPIMAGWQCSEKAPYHPLIAAVYFGRGHAPREIAEATARLFAAAPALLALAKEAANHGYTAQDAARLRSSAKEILATI